MTEDQKAEAVLNGLGWTWCHCYDCAKLEGYIPETVVGQIVRCAQCNKTWEHVGNWRSTGGRRWFYRGIHLEGIGDD